MIVTHNMQQANRVSNYCAFFLAEENQPGRIVEHGPTKQMFESPHRPEDRGLCQWPLRLRSARCAVAANSEVEARGCSGGDRPRDCSPRWHLRPSRLPRRRSMPRDRALPGSQCSSGWVRRRRFSG